MFEAAGPGRAFPGDLRYRPAFSFSRRNAW